MTRRNSPPLITIGIGLVIVIGAIIGGYFALRYTILADVRESLSSVDPSDTIAYGQTLFTTRGCVGCHTLSSVGAMGDEGPDLSDIGSRHEAAYIRESIMTPNAIIATGCPNGECEASVMPQFGQILAAEQVDALVAFLQEQE